METETIDIPVENPNPQDWILLEDDALIAFRKPAMLPTQPDPTGDVSLAELAEKYCESKLYVLHRLDRPTSGVVVFAKTEQAAAALSHQFQERSTRKTYLAVVEQKPEKAEDTLVHFLKIGKENSKTIAYAEPSGNLKRAEMRYILRGSSDRYHLLEIELLTGRHHQIRAQLAAIRCPIKGDVKYGARRANADRAIHLHAWRLAFRHPTTLENVTLEADLPSGDAVWDFFQKQITTVSGHISEQLT